MLFFLTEDQEISLNFILDEENKKICDEQLNSEDFPEELKQIVRKTVEAGSPIPAFDPQIGYYTISFTPCEQGNRIYLHHHLTNVSRIIYDPVQAIISDDIINDDSTNSIKELDDPELPEIIESTTNNQNEYESSKIIDSTIINDQNEYGSSKIIDPMTFGNNPPEYSKEQIESMFGSPPKEVLDVMPPKPIAEIGLQNN